jgi:hypothetical protein
MQSSREILLVTGILLVSVLIVLIATEFAPLSDRGPEYVAKNIALSIDSASAAPEDIYVKYTIPEDDWKESSITNPLAKPRVVSLLMFKKGSNLIRVHRFDICEAVVRGSWEALLAGLGYSKDVIADVGEDVVNFGEDVYDFLTGNVVKITGYSLGGISEQAREAKYHRMDGDIVDYEFSKSCYGANCDVVVLGAANKIAGLFEDDFNFYDNPDAVVIKKEYHEDNKAKFKICVKCTKGGDSC